MNPKQIQWKYFYKNPDGSTSATYDEPRFEGDANPPKKIAPLLMNLGCGADEKYHNAFQMLVAEGFCVCAPCDPKKKSGKNVAKKFVQGEEISADYLSDLSFQTDSYRLKVRPAIMFPLSPIEGFEQMASAISRGYDMIDWEGGLGLTQKIPYILDYFRQHKEELPKKKPKFYGYSNASQSVMMHEIIQPICSPALASIYKAQKQEESLLALQVMKGEKEFVEQKLVPLNEIAREKYSAKYAPDSGKKPPYLYHFNNNPLDQNLRSINEFRPLDGRKIILVTEFVTHPEIWKSCPELLERFLARYQELGLLAQIEYIELDDMSLGFFFPQKGGRVAFELFKLGHKVEFLERIGVDLASLDQDKSYDEQEFAINSLFNDQKNQAKISEEIDKLNQQLQAEQNGVIEVANKFRIALLASPGKRSGHNGVILLEPCGSENEIRVGVDGIITRKTSVDAIDAPTKPAPCRALADFALAPKDKAVAPSSFARTKIDFGKMRLEAINEAAKSMDFGGSKALSGGEIKCAMNEEVDPEKGQILINKSEIDWLAIRNLESLLIRGFLGKSAACDGFQVPFIIFANDDEKSLDGKMNGDFMDKQRDLVQKFVEHHNVTTPIFFAPDILHKTPDLVSGNFVAICDLHKRKDDDSERSAEISEEDAAREKKPRGVVNVTKAEYDQVKALDSVNEL